MTTTITSEYMQQMLQSAKPYLLVILKAGPNYSMPSAEGIIRQHVRRNFEMRAEGKLAIVCPVTDGGGVRGIGIFTVGEEELKKIMDEDPGVQAGIFVYETHPVRGFPGDSLP